MEQKTKIKRFQFSVSMLLTCLLFSSILSAYLLVPGPATKIEWSKYSPELRKKSVENGRDVLIVIRSEYSIWHESMFQDEYLSRRQSEGELVAFDLVYKWESPGAAREFFDRHGFSKEAFVVLITSEGSKRIWPWPENDFY